MSEAREKYYEFKIADEVWGEHRPPVIHYSAVDYIAELEKACNSMAEFIKLQGWEIPEDIKEILK